MLQKGVRFLDILKHAAIPFVLQEFTVQAIGMFSSCMLISCTCIHRNYHLYGTAQLQGNACTHLECMQDVLGTNAGLMLDASGTSTRRVHASPKSCDKAAAKLT